MMRWILGFWWLFAQPALAITTIELTHQESIWLAAHPVIRTRIFDLPPINYWDGGPRGIAVDTAEAILGKLGVRLDYQYGPGWLQTLDDLRAHQGVDLLLNAQRTPERKAFLAFSQDYLNQPWVIFTRTDEDGIFSLEDLFDKTMAIEEGYVLQEKLAQDYPLIQQKLFKDTAAALLAVSDKQADAYIGNLTVVQYYITQRGFSNIKVSAGTGLGAHTQAFAVRNDWPLLISILDKGLATLSAEERNGIHRKYFTVELTERVDYTRLWQIAGVSFLLMAMMLYWNRRLAREIALRKQAEECLRQAASVFDHAREGIMITALNGDILDVNQAFSRITGYRREEVLGKNPRLLSSGRHDHDFYATLWRELKEHGFWSGEVWNRRKSGEVYAELQTISAIRDQHGQLHSYVALFSDITPLKEHQSQLEHLAHYDALTGLPNRLLLADRLRQAMKRTLRHDIRLAVVYLDLDGFKAINDHQGHDVGDRLLTTVADRMKYTLREGDTLARFGGDEFVAVLLDLTDIESCAPLLTRLLTAAAEEEVHDRGLVLRVSASLGVTFYPQIEEIDADQLLHQADHAMYQAKLAGKNRYHIFDTERDLTLRSQAIAGCSTFIPD